MIDKGYIKEAIHCYVTAIRLMPKFSAAHSNLGMCLYSCLFFWMSIFIAGSYTFYALFLSSSLLFE